MEGVIPSIRCGKLLIGIGGGLALSHMASKLLLPYGGVFVCSPDLMASL